jgi:hypothetical protein
MAGIEDQEASVKHHAPAAVEKISRLLAERPYGGQVPQLI